MRTTWRERVGRVFATYGFWIVMTVVTLLPIWWMFVVSMRSRVELFWAAQFDAEPLLH